MTTAPTDLVTNLELRLAYSPAEGRLWRTDTAGRIQHELATWRYLESGSKLAMNYISCPGLGGRRANQIIFYIMSQRWPLADHVIDHIDRDPRNNRWSNLRECTSSQNAMNCDRSYRRLHATDELLEAGVRKDLRTGNYVVYVCQVYGGTFKSRIEANEVCRQMRRELKGEFDVPFKSSRRMIRGRPAP
jgi:hypothetical protein